MPLFTTNVEFGYWLHSGKVVYGRPSNAPKTKYLDWLYKLDYDKDPCNDLETLLKASSLLANNLYSEFQSEMLPLCKRKILKKLDNNS